LRRLGTPSVDVGEAVSEEEIVVAGQKKGTGGDGVRSTMQDRSSAMYGVRVDVKRWKANVIENGTTKEPTVNSIGLATILAAVFYCNVVDISGGGRHLTEHCYELYIESKMWLPTIESSGLFLVARSCDVTSAAGHPIGYPV